MIGSLHVVVRFGSRKNGSAQDDTAVPKKKLDKLCSVIVKYNSTERESFDWLWARQANRAHDKENK